MALVALIVRLLLSALFSIAGIAKLADLPGTRKSITDFGVPQWATFPLSIALPMIELGIAAALVPATTTTVGCWTAIALLTVFIAGTGISLARGRTPECHCFGQLHSKPISWRTLAQNLVLISCVALVLWIGNYYAPISAVAWMFEPSAAGTAALFVALGALCLAIAEGWGLLHLIRQNGRLLLRMDEFEQKLSGQYVPPEPKHAGLPIGTPAPAFELPSLSGALVSLAAFRAMRRPIILVFSDPNCGPCSALLPDFARWAKEYKERLTMVIVSIGTPEANVAKIGAADIEFVLMQRDREVAQAYMVTATPSAVYIDTEGAIGHPLAEGAEAIAGLVARVTGSESLGSLADLVNMGALSLRSAQSASTGLAIGEPAPPVRLPDLSGTLVDLAASLRRKTLLIFWDPLCGFCERMLPDLTNRLQREGPNWRDEIDLALISTGSAETHHSLGFATRILLDQSFATARPFHVTGTPSAVVIDREGKIASDVAVGAIEIFALIDGLLRISHTPDAVA